MELFRKYKYQLGLVCVVIITFLLRLWGLDRESLWFDEFMSLKAAVNICGAFKDFDILKFIGPVPIFYFALLKIWILFFGYTAFSVRFLSVIVGTFSVIALYFLTKSMFDNFTALIAVFLLSISPAHIFYSQEARQYSIYLLLTVLVYLCWQKQIKDQKYQIFLFCLLFPLINTHFFGIFILLSVIILAMTTLAKPRKTFFIKGIIFVLAFFLTFSLFFYKNIFHAAQRSIAWMKLNSVNKPIQYTLDFFSYGGVQLGGQDFSLSFPKALTVIFPLVYAGLFIAGFFYILVVKKKEFKILSLWLLLPFVIIVGISTIILPVFLGRHIFNLLPAFIIFIAVAISRIKNKNFALFFLLIILILVLNATTLYAYYSQEKRMQIKEAAWEIKKTFEDGEKIIFYPSFARYHLVFFLNEDVLHLTKLREVPEDMKYMIDAPNEHHALRCFQESINEKLPPKIYFVKACWSIDLKEEVELYEFIQKHYRLIYKKEWARLKLFTYQLIRQ